MAWTAPATWSVSQLVTATDLNEQVKGNLLSIHDDNVGAMWVVLEDDADRTTAFNNTDAEKARATILMADHNTAGLKLQLRLVGSRLVDTLGGGSDAVKLQYGSRNVADTGDPSWTTASTITTANDTTATWKDTGWVDVTMGTDTLLVVRYTATADNTGQTTTTRMTILARLKDA